MSDYGQYGRLYSTARWQRIRAAQLAREPLCRMCQAEGVTTAATVCDHIDGHPDGETEEQFWAGPFQSLCRTHHDTDKRRAEQGGVVRVRAGADGWPVG